MLTLGEKIPNSDSDSKIILPELCPLQKHRQSNGGTNKLTEVLQSSLLKNIGGTNRPPKTKAKGRTCVVVLIIRTL